MEIKYNCSLKIKFYQIAACIFALFLSISTSEAIKKDDDSATFDLFNQTIKLQQHISFQQLKNLLKNTRTVELFRNESGTS